MPALFFCAKRTTAEKLARHTGAYYCRERDDLLRIHCRLKGGGSVVALAQHAATGWHAPEGTDIFVLDEVIDPAVRCTMSHPCGHTMTDSEDVKIIMGASGRGNHWTPV